MFKFIYLFIGVIFILEARMAQRLEWLTCDRTIARSRPTRAQLRRHNWAKMSHSKTPLSTQQ